MNVLIDEELNLNTPAILGYVYRNNGSPYNIEPSDVEDFVKTETRADAVNERPTIESIKFLLNEEWGIEEGLSSSIVSTNNITVAVSRDVSIDTKYVLYLRKDVPQDVVKKVVLLFNSYKPVSGQSITRYIFQNIPNELGDEDFVIKVGYIISQQGKLQELDVEQRNNFLRMFQLNGGSGQIEGPQNSDGTIDIGTFFNVFGRRPRLLRRSPLNNDDPTTSDTHNEVVLDETIADESRKRITDAKAEEVAQRLQDFLMEGLSCGELRRYENREAKIDVWRELKIDYEWVIIKIKCSKIKFKRPVLKVRKVFISLYTFYVIPKDILDFLFDKAKACAKRAAISSGVIGVITGNPAAAGAAFSSSFRSCMENIIQKCFEAGVFVVKETSNWDRALLKQEAKE
jgi:hypothetical protein